MSINQIGQLFRIHAKQIIPGNLWNETRRKILENSEVEPVIYEVTIRPAEGWEEFRDRVFPLFFKYLDSKGVNPQNYKLALVAVFDGPECFILDGPSFVKVFKELEGLNETALRFRILRYILK